MKVSNAFFIGEILVLFAGIGALGFQNYDPGFGLVKVAETETESKEEAEEPEVEEEVYAFPAAKRAAEKGLPTPPDIDINSWEYLLVNSESTIDGSFIPDTDWAYSSSSETEQDYRVVEPLISFAAAAEAQGLDVYLSSGYRSYETQSYLFELKCEEYDRETAATIVAIPGTSEHQTGLCCDITDIYRSPKNSELENTDTYIWMSAHCQEYGFIVRFPKNKEDITKIIYEPWHFRYVGKEAATYIMENDLCLEEFVELYCDTLGQPAVADNGESQEVSEEVTEVEVDE